MANYLSLEYPMNPEERACMRYEGPDCRYIQAALSYWCINKACCRYSGTSIPGFVNCPYYRPVDKSNFWENFFIGGLLLFYVTLTIILARSLL